jgi:hypothetical protein
LQTASVLSAKAGVLRQKTMHSTMSWLKVLLKILFIISSGFARDTIAERDKAKNYKLATIKSRKHSLFKNLVDYS